MSKNACIQCSIKECKHHCGDENYCSLNQIKVGTHENHPTKIECTDCESFVLRAECFKTGITSVQTSGQLAGCPLILIF